MYSRIILIILQQHLIDNYLPYIPASLQSPLLDALSTQRLRSMPNSYLPPSIQGLPSNLQGAILVGDAYNMRHPLTGGGMTVAFNDAVLLTEYLKPGGKLRRKPWEEGLAPGREGLEDWDKIAERLREWFWERKQLSGVVNVLSMALYSLFGGSDSTSPLCVLYSLKLTDCLRSRSCDPKRRVFQVL